jgi:hypothetical protein
LSGLITTSAVKIMGAFAEWQPAYAASGIATFPVIINDKGKPPAVSGYFKVGLEYSNQLSLKFPANDSFGFALGVRSSVTVLDVDTSDERVLADEPAWRDADRRALRLRQFPSLASPQRRATEDSSLR